MIFYRKSSCVSLLLDESEALTSWWTARVAPSAIRCPSWPG